MLEIKNGMKRLYILALCRVFGHVPTYIEPSKMEATCGRCGSKLNVSYDMSNGETIVLKAIK